MVNIGNMMKQAQQLQKKIADAQEKLNAIEVEGTSGGGLVKVISTAKGEVKRIIIDDTIFKPEEKEITEDLIVAARWSPLILSGFPSSWDEISILIFY